MIRLYGYETALQQRTFNTYEDVHCFHSAGIHDYLKFLKLGYGKITDHASREIRLRRMTREEGIDLVSNLKNDEPEDLNIFLDWVELNKQEFKSYYWEKRDLRVWKKEKNGKWEMKDNIKNYKNSPLIEKVRLNKKENCNFILTESAEPDIHDNNYLLMGRNYIDKNNYGAVRNSTAKGSMTKRIWKETKV